MASDSTTLDFTRGEALRVAGCDQGTTHIFQLEDGTIFYHRFFAFPKTLYALQDSKEIEVALPRDNDCFGVHGNALYFEANTEAKLYKAHFSPQDAAISVTYLRDLVRVSTADVGSKKDEEAHAGGLCTRLRDDGKKYVYRMADDPHKDGVSIDFPEEEGMTLSRMIRGKVYYRKVNPDIDHPRTRVLSENAVLIEFPNAGFLTTMIARDSCPFAYFTDCKSLFTLDLETLQFLKPLSLGIEVDGLGGVHEGVVTVLSGNAEGEKWLATASLPEEYVTK